jgi:hypothetical protein
MAENPFISNESSKLEGLSCLEQDNDDDIMKIREIEGIVTTFTSTTVKLVDRLHETIANVALIANEAVLQIQALSRNQSASPTFAVRINLRSK